VATLANGSALALNADTDPSQSHHGPTGPAEPVGDHHRQFTHFVQGTTTASFGAGITVASLTVKLGNQRDSRFETSIQQRPLGYAT